MQNSTAFIQGSRL